MGTAPARGLAVAVAAVLLGAGCGVTGPGGTGPGGRGGAVDVRSLEHELATVLRLQKLGQGYDYDAVGVRCDPASADRRHFDCWVYAILADGRVNSWKEPVDCGPKGRVGELRCTSAGGFALQ